MFLKREHIQPEVSKLYFPHRFCSPVPPLWAGMKGSGHKEESPVAPLQEGGSEPSGPAEILTALPRGPCVVSASSVTAREVKTEE